MGEEVIAAILTSTLKKVIWYTENTVPVKSLDTPTHSRVFLYFIYFLHCQECAKLSSRQRVATLKNLKYKIYLDLFNTFGYYMIPYVLFHKFDVFTIILQCRK
jgi:hypothetical protein